MDGDYCIRAGKEVPVILREDARQLHHLSCGNKVSLALESFVNGQDNYKHVHYQLADAGKAGLEIILGSNFGSRFFFFFFFF